jgi:hypothetical protein
MLIKPALLSYAKEARQLRRPCFALADALTALSMARTAFIMALPLELDTPVLVLLSSRCTVHLKPVGLAVCTT